MAGSQQGVSRPTRGIADRTGWMALPPTNKQSHHLAHPDLCSFARFVRRVSRCDAQLRAGVANEQCHRCTEALFVRSLCPQRRAESLPCIPRGECRSCCFSQHFRAASSSDWERGGKPASSTARIMRLSVPVASPRRRSWAAKCRTRQRRAGMNHGTQHVC